MEYNNPRPATGLDEGVFEDGTSDVSVNLNPDDFSDTFGFQTRTTNRAYRSYELLNRDTDITYEEISLIKHDNKFSYNSPTMSSKQFKSYSRFGIGNFVVISKCS